MCYTFECSVQSAVQVVKDFPSFHDTVSFIAVKDTICHWISPCTIAGSIPAGVIGIFFDIKSFRSHYGPGVDSASNINEYQEHFLGVMVAGA